MWQAYDKTGVHFMISERVCKTAVEQVNAELYSSYLYLSMSSWADSQGLKGFANWTRVQAQEELVHAIFLHNQIMERGGRSILLPIQQPPSEWESPLAMFENILHHEEHVTALINNLASLALEEKDHAMYNFMQLYVDEQVEEEASATDIVVKLRRIGDNAALLYMMDNELAARVYAPPFGGAAATV
jgi:ferritin